MFIISHYTFNGKHNYVQSSLLMLHLREAKVTSIYRKFDILLKFAQIVSIFISFIRQIKRNEYEELTKVYFTFQKYIIKNRIIILDNNKYLKGRKKENKCNLVKTKLQTATFNLKIHWYRAIYTKIF